MKIIKAGGSSSGMRKCITFYSIRDIDIGVLFVVGPYAVWMIAKNLTDKAARHAWHVVESHRLQVRRLQLIIS